MVMEKTGAPQPPQMGVALTPWPNGSKVLVYKGESGFVPQPTVTNQVCLLDGCTGVILIWPDNHKQCQKCLRVVPEEK
jgi:hypothetical protein